MGPGSVSVGRLPLPVVTPTSVSSEGQPSCQPPPTRESTTCEIFIWCQPGGRSNERLQLPLSLARVVHTRLPTWMLTSASGSAQSGPFAPVRGIAVALAELERPRRDERLPAEGELEPRRRHVELDAALGRVGDVRVGAEVRDDLVGRRVRGRVGRLEEVDEVLAGRKVRATCGT